MAITPVIDIIENALWQQHDARDPLGIWGFRSAIAGDGSGGTIKWFIQVPANKSGKYVYNVVSLNLTHDAGSILNKNLKIRLLTSWPNIDPQAGVQAYSVMKRRLHQGDITWSAPIEAPQEDILGPLDRFILLFDPRTANNAITLFEAEVTNTGIGEDYSFEGYGYFWDRGALAAPGGVRFPGAN